MAERKSLSLSQRFREVVSQRRVAAVAGSALVAVGSLAGSVAAAPGPTVVVTNRGYSPAAVVVKYGTAVTWSFRQGTHTVTDATRLGLYNSPSKRPGSTYSVTFNNSGTFPYRSTVGGAIRGTVGVPITASPATGSRTTYFAVRWGADYTRPGYNEQVELKTPGSATWTSFVYGTPYSNATMRAADWGNRPGVYQFRAKLYRGNDPNVSSGWSPIARITVR